ncbi:MAG: macro domain-containing protein [Streptococcaceae bacterium]|jgi:O-acetyl-ADP-ribose deacetylase (regulator of RNase III)|nr:macro domain-containing protein [Streptococcaceae bacterium]
MTLKIIKEDLTNLKVDAIVSSDDEHLSHSGGVSMAIARKAGTKQINEDLAQKQLATTQTFITKGYNLPAKFIIHVVAPRYDKQGNTAEILLRKSYQTIFRQAKNLSLDSIGLPLLDSGSFKFPKELDMKIFESDEYLDEMFAQEVESFTKILLRLIDETGEKDSDVYKRANMDRKHFSKIRSNLAYQPRKNTVFALAIALKLDINMTKKLLESAFTVNQFHKK